MKMYLSYLGYFSLSLLVFLSVTSCGSRCLDPNSINNGKKGDCVYPSDDWVGRYDVTYTYTPTSGSGSGFTAQSELEILKATNTDITVKNLGGCTNFFTATIPKLSPTEFNGAPAYTATCDAVSYTVSLMSGSIIPSTGDISLSFHLTPTNPALTWYNCAATGKKK